MIALLSLTLQVAIEQCLLILLTNNRHFINNSHRIITDINNYIVILSNHFFKDTSTDIWKTMFRKVLFMW